MSKLPASLLRCLFWQAVSIPGLWCRRHCNQEPDWSTPAIFLDEFDGAGWKLVSELLGGERSAHELLANEFVLTV